MDFPSLTGRKPPTQHGGRLSTSIESDVTYTSLCNATASAGALPVSAVQAAWAVILSTYLGVHDNVIFATAIALPPSNASTGASNDAYSIFPTQAQIYNAGNADTANIGDFLKHLTSCILSSQPKGQATDPTTTSEQLNKHGTLVAFHDKECSGDGTPYTTYITDGHVALEISVRPCPSGFLSLQATYTDYILDHPGALVVLAQLNDVLAFITKSLERPLQTTLTAVRTTLLSISNQDLPYINGYHTDTPRLQSQFEETARENQDRVALEFWYDLDSEKFTTWTYAELNTRAEVFARSLIHSFGHQSNKVVPICMERRPELYVAILGILKSGGAWCPVDASFPARRRHDLIARTGSDILVVADRNLAEQTDGIPLGVKTVDITTIFDANVKQVDLYDVKIGRLAYLIWTSGTTGAPKGVPIGHEAAITSMRALQRSIPTDVAGGAVRCMQFSHFTFDVFVQDLFYTWGVGGTIISSTRGIMLGSFSQLANKTNATHAHLTPAFAASVPRQRCRTLEVITMIGEKLSQVVADDWGQDMRAFNTYGPAETAVVSTFRQFGADDDEIQSENIGFPLPSVSAFVMRHGLPLMRHGVGELALGGPQLSEGYWNDPEKTAGRFIWNEQFSRNLYMTGDMVRQLHDGSLTFVGREDDLIKIQGIRVELSEISFGLRACHPLVEQVEIQYLEREDRPSKVIVAFLAVPTLSKDANGQIAVQKAAPIARSALLEAQNNLPDYMIPRVFLVVKSIPRTPSNKTDKNALKRIYSSIDLGAWERALADNDGNMIEEDDWTQEESSIVAAVAELSGTSQDSMSRHSDLRSIGIDSIAATRLAPMLNKQGLSLSVADVLQCQNLDDIVKISANSNLRTQGCDLEAFHNLWYSRVRKSVKRDDFVVAPALPLQESLLSESMQDAKAYWSNTFLSLDTHVDLTRLQEAWTHVVTATEALRTGFIPSAAILDDGDETRTTFLQLTYKNASIDWTCIDIPNDNIEAVATQQAQIVAERHQKNAFQDPPLAITVLEQTKDRTLMISIHHSIRDEPSLDFILEDVRKRYNGEFVSERHQLGGALRLLLPTAEQIGQDEAFWSKLLSEVSSTDNANAFPNLTGSNHQATEGFVSYVQALTLSYRDLQNAAFQLGATSVASILRVAWGCILLMYLETESTVFAETWSERIDDPSLADAVGPFTSVLPVPFRAIGTAREALVAQSHSQQDSRAHRSIHGRAVRRLLRRPEHQSVYPAVFNFLPNNGEDSQQDSSIWHQLENSIALSVEHPLALNVTPANTGGVDLELIASQQVISRAHLALLAQQLDAFIMAMLETPDVPLMRLSSHFSESLISKTSVEFSDEVKHASQQDPLTWVDYYAEIHPQWPAAMYFHSIDQSESDAWTYKELQAAYNRVAAFIRHHGHRHEMIAVCLDRRLEAYAVLLGILASGNTYLPIDEELPEERKSFLVQDSQAVMLFTTTTLASSFRNSGTRLVFVDADTYNERIPNGQPVEILATPEPTESAYLLYTSGSTGVPKGVLVGRGNLCSFIEGLSEYIHPLIPGMQDLPGKGRYLGLASRAFDVHLAEMFLAWRRGMAAVTAPRTILLDNLELALQTLKITHASFVPSLIDQAGLDPANLPDLHYLGVGGEMMSKRVVDIWAASANAALINAYGPTEMSIGCTAAEVTAGSNLRNIGRPYGNSVAHVLVPGTDDYTLRGVAGELCFTGDLVAKGYYNRPDAKGFVDDFRGQRMYRTGDIVRLMVDDTLEYLRREDDQTKVRGQRLELGEISEAIRSSVASTPGFTKIDVATIVAQYPKLPRSQLVSFVVAHRSDSESPEMLRTSEGREIASMIQNHCQKVLPSYMVPDVVIPLTKLPLAPASGKADQKRLKSLYADLPLEDIIHQPAQSDSNRRELTLEEQTVRSVVSSSLAIDGTEINSNTNLFRLGLDSLSAINVTIRMQRLGYDCTVSAVLKNPTLEQLALLPRKVLEEGVQTHSQIAAIRNRFLKAYPDTFSRAVKPCLPLQETLVASSLDGQSSALYVNNIVLKLTDDINLARLEEAWTKVVENHDILRTSFQEFEGGFIQIVREPTEPRARSWEEVTVSDLESAVQKMQSAPPSNIITEIGQKPPLRLTLLRSSSGAEGAVLLVQMHHALYDGESFAMILGDLDKHYRSETVPSHTSFDSLIEHVYSQDQEGSKNFWNHYLAGYEPLSTAQQVNIGEPLAVDRTLASSLADLESFSVSISGTLKSTIQAVFGVVLAQTLGTHDVVFGAVLSGRTVPIENPDTIVAPCITTIPQRVNLGMDFATITDIIKAAQQGFVESLTYQHTALRHIHRWVEASRPLFDCLVTYVQKKSDLRSNLWTEKEGSMINDFPLAVEFEAHYESNQIRAHCAFSTAFGDISKAGSFLENIDLLLGALVRRENVTTEDLGISMTTNSHPRPHVWDDSNWSPTEVRMQELAAELCGIGVREIFKGSSFFSLGIDSITAIRYAQRLRQSDIMCSSADVMRYASIGALAKNIGALPYHTNNIKPQEFDRRDIIPKIPVLSQDDVITDVYQCSPLQSSMLTQTLGSDGRLYSHQHTIRLSDTVDLLRLRHAWMTLTTKTEILRTTFHFVENSASWIAAVHEGNYSTWTEVDSLHKITEDFTLDKEVSFEHPPWKTTIFKQPTQTVLVISMHHSLYDGVSINLLFEDLTRLYNAVDLPSRSPFSDAARTISNSSQNAEDFWLQKLRGYDGVQFTSTNTMTEITSSEHELEKDVEQVLQGCKDLGVTVQTVALLAFAKSLACVSRRRDIVFGHVVGGRSLAIPDADNIIGPLFNTVPPRITLNKTYITNESMVKQIQQSSGESQAYQHASLAKVQQRWRQQTANTNAQLFDSVFVFQNNANTESFADSLGIPINIGGAVDPTEYSMNVEFEQGKGRLMLKVNAFKTQEEVHDWVTIFGQIFQDILEHPSRSVLAFPSSLQSLPLSLRDDKSSSNTEDAIEPGSDMDSIREALSRVSQIPSHKISSGVSIFSLGLDSIAAIRVAADCRKQGYAVSVADVLQGRSVGGICRRVRERRSQIPTSHTEEKEEALIGSETKSKARALANVQEADVEDVLPCLAGQLYHLASWLQSNRTTCEAVFTYQCSEHLDIDSLRQAWRRLRDRHSILRTVFVALSPAEAVQVIMRPSALNDDSFESIEHQSTITEHVARELDEPFDLFSPPCKLQLIRGENKDYICLKLHHATYDAWTIPILVSDLTSLYHKTDLSSPPPFSSFISNTIHSLHTSSQQTYWRKSLSDCQRALLTDSTSKSTTVGPTFLTLPSALRNLSILTRHCTTTCLPLPTLLLATFARPLARATSTKNPTFGVYQTGRSASFPAVEELCAPCLNVTPVCVQDALNLPIEELAKRLQADFAERVAYEQSFLGEVLGWVDCGEGKEKREEGPMFNSYVNILSNPPAKETNQEVEEKQRLFTPLDVAEKDLLKPEGVGPSTGKQTRTTAVDRLSTSYLAEKNFYLDIVRREDDDCVDFTIKCDSALMDEDGVKAFVDEIVREVEEFVEEVRGKNVDVVEH
ncbi:MAG: hypothetical protein L6R40_002375 [Gallowayella cf. fulva]|nr:MAG: hypothetical protein L6R40_002375 [Xanthomendoza cf. fulva]